MNEPKAKVVALHAPGQPEVRDLILSAAAGLANARGVSAMRFEDIAADVGMTKTIVSYYFSSKDLLVQAGFEVFLDALEQATGAALAAGEDPQGRLAVLIGAWRAVWTKAEQGRAVRPMVLTQLGVLPNADRGRLQERYRAASAAILRICARGATPTAAEAARAAWVLGVLRQAPFWPAYGTGAPDPVLMLARGGLRLIRRRALTMPPHPPPDPVPLAIFNRDVRNRLKREAFLRTAIRRFNDSGYAGVGLSELAEELGVSRGTFYYHFPDKGALLEAALDDTFDALERLIALTESETLSERAGALGVLGAIVRQQILGAEPYLRLPYLHAAPQAARARGTARWCAIVARFAALLHAAQSRGDIEAPPDLPVELLLRTVLSETRRPTLMASGLTQHWDPLSDPGARVDHYLEAIAAPAE